MTTPKSDEKNKETFNGTLIFWLCEIMGELGIHCFVSGRTLRGLLYLSMTIISCFIIPLAVPFVMFLGKPMYGLDLIAGIMIFIVTVLVFIDAWTIGNGHYENKINGKKYRGGLWMKVVAILGLVLNLTYVVFGGYFFNMSETISNDLKTRVVTVLNAGVDDYLEKQGLFFDKEHQIGSFEQIGYASHFKYFDFIDLNAGLKISYKLNFGCPHQSIWTITPSIVDGKLKWNVTEPEDTRCSEFFPLKLNLKEK